MRRWPAAALAPVASSVLAVLAALLVGGLFLEARGKDTPAAYRLLVARGLGTPYGVAQTLTRVAPLLMVAAGLLIALKAGVWNIGVDGQVLVGALAVGVVAPRLAGGVPRPLLWLLCGGVGFAGGVAWATAPAVLRVRFGLNEIITTLMMNYVAISLTAWLVNGPVKDPASVPPQTAPLAAPDRLPNIPGTDVHVGLVVGLLAVGSVALLFRGTVVGFQLRILGQNRPAALHAGMPVGRLTLLALLLSGGFAGLAGANDVLGVHGLFKDNWNPGYGFSGFALVYLARLNALWTIPFAYFFSFLLLGGEMMARGANVPTGYVQLLEGLMLVCFALVVALERLGLAPGGRRRGAVEPAGESPAEPFTRPAEEPTG